MPDSYHREGLPEDKSFEYPSPAEDTSMAVNWSSDETEVPDNCASGLDFRHQAGIRMMIRILSRMVQYGHRQGDGVGDG